MRAAAWNLAYPSQSKGNTMARKMKSSRLSIRLQTTKKYVLIKGRVCLDLALSNRKTSSNHTSYHLNYKKKIC